MSKCFPMLIRCPWYFFIVTSESPFAFAAMTNKCEEMLHMKKKEYTGDHEDRLSAFKIAASLQDCTPQRALVGMMAKHIVSSYDMCYAKNTSFTKELWDEKITDSLNYLFLLAAIIKEEGTYEQN